MSLRRGFKAEAERISGEIRHELELGMLDRLDPLRLAEHFGIPVLTLLDVATQDSGGTRFLGTLQGVESDSFSAITIFLGSRRLIIHNESHAPARQVSNVTHERRGNFLISTHIRPQEFSTQVESAKAECWR